MDPAVLLEAEKRGLLPPDRKAMLDEARRRGLVDATPPPVGRQSVQSYVKEKMKLNDYAYRGNILPFGEDSKGNKEWAYPQIAVSLMESLALPGHAARGGSYTPQDTLQLAALISPVSTATRAGEFSIPGAKTAHKAGKVKVPTTKELKAAASSAYDDAARLGVDYTSSSVKGMADDIVRTLESEGRIGETNPQLFALLKKLQEPPSGSVVSLDGLKAFRSRLGEIAGSKEPAVASSATIALKKLDRFLENADPSSVVVRPPPPAGQTLPSAPGQSFLAQDASYTASAARTAAQKLAEARGNSAAAFRSSRLSKIMDSADLRAAAANSGKNLGNTIRQKLASFLESPAKTRGFSPEELSAIKQVVEGTASVNTLRYVSNVLGGGGGLGQSLFSILAGGGTYALTQNPMLGIAATAIPAAGGAATRSLANAMTKSRLGGVEKTVRMRSPLYEQRLANPPMNVPLPTEQMLANKLLLIEALGKPPQPRSIGDYRDMF